MWCVIYFIWGGCFEEKKRVVTAVGLEPTTNRLKAECSTTELHGQTQYDVDLF